MRNLIKACCLLAAFVGLVSGQTEQWKQYKYPEGNFSATFPSEPQDSVNTAQEGLSSHTIMAQQSGTVYMVVYTAMRNEQKVDDPTYRVFKEAVFKELPKCEVVTEEAPSLPLAGYIGHWYQLNCAMTNQIAMIGNLYWGKHYAYAVMSMYPAAKPEPPTAKNFVNSFAVLDGAK